MMLLNGFFVLCMAAAISFAEAGEYPDLTQAPNCSRPAGSMPRPDLPPGTPNPDIPINHIMVMMAENHSFDNFFGRLNEFGYAGQVDGITPDLFNIDSKGNVVRPFRLDTYCVRDPAHEWDESHEAWNGGKNDQFAALNDFNEKGKYKGDGYRALGYYEATDMPFYYGLANAFAIGDRYFSSLMGPTQPNRYYMIAASSYGLIENKIPASLKNAFYPTIFDVLDAYGVSWKYYYTDIPVYLPLFSKIHTKFKERIFPASEYRVDLAGDTLPSVAFFENSALLGDEHPPINFQLGQYISSKRVQNLFKSKAWKDTVLFMTYDEHGGFYDHVAPPEACKPDEHEPEFAESDQFRTGFDRYGFRVPFMAISPYVKRHHVSHVTYDHTSILKFIETKFNLPALSKRDANADAMMDLFDFQNPNFEIPKLPEPKINWGKVLGCLSFKKPKRPAALNSSHLPEFSGLTDAGF